MKRKISGLLLLIIFLIFTIGCLSEKQSILYNNEKRTFLLHLPKGYERSYPAPLVIVLHGGGGNSKNIEKVSKFSDKADKEGFIVVYPDGTGNIPNIFTWNGGFCCGYALENKVDDVGFIMALIDSFENQYNIDSNRIYVTGISNGGIMSYRLASELSEVIAAAAPVAASACGKASEYSEEWINTTPVDSVSIIAFNGSLDARVPYDGGLPIAENTRGAYSYLSVDDSIKLWIRNNGCIPICTQEISESGNIIIDRYSDCNDETEVVLYTIVNGAHAWPGGRKGFIGGDNPTEEISATDIIWDFFKTHPKK
jgi:polyhydroxybutyrate depolymerase